MSNSKNESGPFESILTIAGLITGAMVGYEQGEILGAIIGAVVLATIRQQGRGFGRLDGEDNGAPCPYSTQRRCTSIHLGNDSRCV